MEVAGYECLKLQHANQIVLPLTLAHECGQAFRWRRVAVPAPTGHRLEWSLCLADRVVFVQHDPKSGCLYHRSEYAGKPSSTSTAKLGFGYRAKFIAGTAKALCERAKNKLEEEKKPTDDEHVNAAVHQYLESLRQLDYYAAREALMQFLGIGPKVADCIALMSLDQHSSIPVDRHVFSFADRWYGIRKKRYDQVADSLREIWGSHAGWAHSVLFYADLRSFAGYGDNENALAVKRESCAPPIDEKLMVTIKSEMQDDDVKSSANSATAQQQDHHLTSTVVLTMEAMRNRLLAQQLGLASPARAEKSNDTPETPKSSTDKPQIRPWRTEARVKMLPIQVATPDGKSTRGPAFDLFGSPVGHRTPIRRLPGHMPDGTPMKPADRGKVFNSGTPTRDRISAKEREEQLQAMLEGMVNVGDHVDMSKAHIDGLKCRLLPHQIQGVEWMKSRELGDGKGGILADDMGLGKTVQMLALTVSHPNAASIGVPGDAKTTLIIAPLAVIQQWESEAADKTGNRLKVHIHHGNQRAKNAHTLMQADLVVTTYATLTSEYSEYLKVASGSDSESEPESPRSKREAAIAAAREKAKQAAKRSKSPLFDVHWLRVVLDEAQNIKNHRAKGTNACCTLKAHTRWCLSGTPLQNNAMEIYSLIHFLRIQPFSDIAHFTSKIDEPLRSTSQQRVDQGIKVLQLPKRTVEIIRCELSQPGEREFYDALESRMRSNYQTHETGESKMSMMGILVMLLRLRQACNHPALVNGQVAEPSEAIAPAPTPQDEGDDLADMLASLSVKERHCERCQRTLEKEDDKLCTDCEAQQKAEEKHGIDWARPGAMSTKVSRLVQLLEDVLKRPDEKVIVFSQFTRFLDLIEPFLRQRGINYVRYDGSMRRDQREAALNRLKREQEMRVILMSFKAGSTGLNLTCCNHVVLMDLWWNPQIEEQAFDRAHRLGQTRPVFVYKFSIADSVEERILDLQEKKRALTNAALGGARIPFLFHPYVLYLVGTVSALYTGATVAIVDLLYGYWSEHTNLVNPPEDVKSYGSYLAWILTVFGVTVLIMNTVFSYCFNLASFKLATQLRRKYVASILAQDPTFFEHRGPGDVANLINKDVSIIRTALGDKFGFMTNAIGTLITCFIVAFSRASVVSGIAFSTFVFGIIVLGIVGFVSDKITSKSLDIESRMASFIEHILSSVRVVQSYNMGPELVKRLNDLYMKPFNRYALLRSTTKGVDTGALYFVIGAMYSITFWYGSIKIGRGEEEVKNVIAAFFNFLNGLFSLATILPQMQSVFESTSTLKKMRRDIERVPRVDIRNTQGEILGTPSLSQAPGSGSYVPSLALEHVTFAYPARPHVASLNDVSINFEPGKLTALVGPSGSGKSTVTALLLREYDPETSNLPENPEIEDPEEHMRVQGSGRILFGGRDIRELNLRWFRSQVAIVRQSPQLFSGTIFENVAMGLARTKPVASGEKDQSYGAEEEVRERVISALKKAEAWDFVSRLPQGMDTMLAGGSNVHLSGGQRQRLAIARALVSEPQILCLDEATSALDTATEERIKQTLENEQRTRGMTTIVIAHRLSTIQNADCIVTMRQGQVIESGTHETLMHREGGIYRNMVLHNMRAAGMLTDTDEKEHIGAQLLPTFTTESFLHPKHAEEAAHHRAHFALPSELLGRSGAAGSYVPGLESSAHKAHDVPEESDSKRTAWPMHAFIRIIKGQIVYFIIGFIFALMLAAAFPINGWISGGILEAVNIRNDIPRMRERSNWWSLWFFVLAICMLIVGTLSTFFLEFASEQMIQNTRLRSLSALISQEVAFFDEKSNSSGALGSAVFTHASNIGLATGMVATQLIMAIGNIIGSMIMSFVMDWRMSIVCIPFLMTLIGGSYMNMLQLEKLERRLQEPVDRTSAYVSEVVDSIATVTSLGYQDRALSRLVAESRPRKSYTWPLILSSTGYAYAQFVLYTFAALSMFWGAKLLAERKLDQFALFAVFEGLFVGIFAAMRVSTFVPDVSRAAYSVGAVNAWWDRQPNNGITIHPMHDEKDISSAPSRDIVLTNVELRYPQRPEVPALKDLYLRIPENSTVAFCGTSGSGKSSILGILQRFYEPCNGSIEYAGLDIRSIPMDTWRNEMAIVSQDAVLYEGSIRWNLLLGARDPSQVTDADLEDVCRRACVWEFAMGLPDGLDTDVGLKGANLSGGQRQRICIARALLRKPRILLLDEATSALDPESEVLVQQALDNIAGICTTITVAHRLSTIRRANLICVVEDGNIVERGSHEELIQKRGRYFDLVEAQL
ncbi:ABC-type xenobiotic transporter [Malassezia cuniculi]|uniref:ABC-type xenobiotic transporter n=1 Tax=Malassezia cuniculi TaxID=948313 RepID=A0AAF0END3_9BASI|nr:ABC-type xenobiotic transporter [Malassezia cuniculi]